MSSSARRTTAKGSGSPLLVRSLTRSFGRVMALDDVSLVVRAGTIHGLLGANGAGKTTLLRTVLGLLRPDRGEIELLGTTITACAGLPDGVAGSVDLPAFYPHLSARRNLSLLAALDGLEDPRRRVASALERARLTQRSNDRVGNFSFGMRQRLAMAAALLREPRLLILDEPTAGLDPVGVRDLRTLLREFVAAGGSVLLSSHDMGDVELISDDITMLRDGRVVLSEPLHELQGRQNRKTFSIRTTDDVRALAVAAAHGVTASVAAEGLSVVSETAALHTWLVDLAAHGVTPVELTGTGRGLEDVFLAMTQESL